MKPRSRISTLRTSLALLFGAVLGATAVPVTYQVDLSVQTTLGNFIPGNGDTVYVAGSWNAWGAPTLLSLSPTPNIYTVTLDQTAASWPNYKFYINPFGTSSGASLKWENSIANRYFQVPATATNLPVVFFDNVSSQSLLVATQVTFSVNMGVQRDLGNFDPNTDAVWVAGDFNWTEGAQVLTQSGGDTNVWTGTFPITNTVGTTINYKFIKFTSATGVSWEVNGVGPNNANNRQFTFTNQATSLPVVYFNNITNSSSLVTTQVTFKVNVAAQIALGTFDPNSGTVTVAGDPINGWVASTSPLTQTVTNASVWSGTFNITNTVGGAVNYKFTLNNGGTWENNGVGPNNANDRQFIFTNQATVLPDVYFNNLGNLGAVTVSPPINGIVTISWTGGPLIRLQTNATLPGVWGEVPGTAGLSTMDFNASGSAQHFRLIGPW